MLLLLLLLLLLYFIQLKIYIVIFKAQAEVHHSPMDSNFLKQCMFGELLSLLQT
jgi:hypothetical protein